jgi:NtrC-family two-component system sensor histidine kinase KinB
MKIKTKLAIGSGMLFLLITILSALAIRQVNLLAQDTNNILVANYISLDYARNMYKITDNPILTEDDITTLQSYISKQQKNVTEIGEKELTNDLARDFTALQSNAINPAFRMNFRKSLNNIMKLNMDAIQRKAATAENTAESSILWISITSAVCFLIGFTLIFNLPGYIANPIRDLTESIRQIAARNYSQRVYFKGHDEFTTLAKSFNTMAEKLQEYNNSNLAELLTEKKRIDTLVNNMHDPVIGLDEKNTILFINDKALEVSGLKKGQVLGKSAENVAVHNDLIRSLLQKADNYKDNTLKIYADSKESYFEKLLAPISITPTGETEEKRIGSFIILRNVTAYKELDFAKTSFIATVSHEFKTPIASIKMSLQLLSNTQTGSLNAEQHELVESINDDTNRLLRTTGELLNITQVESGLSKIKTTLCHANSIVNDALEGVRKLATQKQVTLQFRPDDNLPDIVADPEKATWIISNLLSNAIRYSYEEGSVSVTTSHTDKAVLIQVADHGMGIDVNYQSRIFDRYFRVPGTEKEGTGLGLSISKEFIEAMGGSITVNSTPGKGSTFTLTFKIIKKA